MTQINKATEGRTLAMMVLIDLAPEGCPQVSCPQQLLFISLQLGRSGAAALQTVGTVVGVLANVTICPAGEPLFLI